MAGHQDDHVVVILVEGASHLFLNGESPVFLLKTWPSFLVPHKRERLSKVGSFMQGILQVILVLRREVRLVLEHLSNLRLDVRQGLAKHYLLDAKMYGLPQQQVQGPLTQLEALRR